MPSGPACCTSARRAAAGSDGPGRAAAARTFGELELAPGRRYRVLAAIPAAACCELAVGELVVFLSHSFSARENGYTLLFAGGPRQWFELRLSDDDPRDSALLGSLHRYLAPA